MKPNRINNIDNKEKQTRGGKGRKTRSHYDRSSKEAKPTRTPAQDPFWYANNADTIEDFASLPFTEVNGRAPFQRGYVAPNAGAVVIPFVPAVPGANDSGNDFATRAANAYYQSVAQGFSANFDFEAPDLLFTALAAADFAAYLSEIPRAIWAIEKFMQSNAVWPDQVVKALGFDPDDLRTNRKEWISQFNLLAGQFNEVIAVPKEFYIGARWKFLSSNAFIDGSDTQYDPIYMYRHGKVLAYEGTRFDTGTSLSQLTVPYTNSFTTFGSVTEVMSFAYQLLNRLTGDDQRQMFAAIRRVYSDSELMKIESITDPITNRELLNHEVMAVQYHNSLFASSFNGTVPGYEDEFTDVAAFQSATGEVRTYTYANITDSAVNGKIDMDRAIVSLAGLDDSPAVLLDITANILPIADARSTAADAKINGHLKVYPRTEVLLYPTIVTAYEIYPKVNPWSNIITTGTELLSRMNRSPILYLTNGSTAYSGVSVIHGCIGEFGKYTTVSMEYLRNLSSKCGYTLLALPMASKTITSK